MQQDEARGRSRYELYETVDVDVRQGRLRTWRQPARLYGANGIRVGPNGRLWVCEVVGDQVTAWDPEADQISAASPMGAPLRGPDDLAFDSEGGVWVTETLNSRVSGRRANGEHVVLTDDCPGANGIVFDRDRRVLYVSEMREDARLLAFDVDTPGEFRIVAEGLQWSNALDRGPDGRLYTPQVLTGTIVAVSPSGEVETVVEGLELPTAVKGHADGRILVSEAAAGRIVAIDVMDPSRPREVIAEDHIGIDNFCHDSHGHLYVSNFVESRVVRFGTNSVEIDRVLHAGGFLGPNGLALWDDQRLLVADANSLALLDTNGEIERLTRLLIDQPFVATGAVRFGDDILALTLAGEAIRLDSQTGAQEKLVAVSEGMTSQMLATGQSAATAVGSSAAGAVVGMADGSVVHLAPSSGSDRRAVKTGLRTVTAVDSFGTTTVATSVDEGTIAIVADGAPRRVDDFEAPEAVAVGEGVAYVAERDAGRIVRVSLASGDRETLVTGLPLGMPRSSLRLGRRCSLLCRPDGSLVVGCDGDGSVRILEGV